MTVAGFEQRWHGHPDSSVDLCVLPITTLLRKIEGEGSVPFFMPFEAEFLPSTEDLEGLSAVEDISMIGYPNGIWDSFNNMPVFRRGVTATHPHLDYAGKKEFMIDAACFPGSSGSPVLLYNVGTYFTRDGITNIGTRIKLLGILYAGPQHTTTGEVIVQNIPTVSKPVAISRIPNNLGLIIKSERLNEFEPMLQAHVDREQSAR